MNECDPQWDAECLSLAPTRPPLHAALDRSEGETYMEDRRHFGGAMETVHALSLTHSLTHAFIHSFIFTAVVLSRAVSSFFSVPFRTSAHLSLFHINNVPAPHNHTGRTFAPCCYQLCARHKVLRRTPVPRTWCLCVCCRRCGVGEAATASPSARASTTCSASASLVRCVWCVTLHVHCGYIRAFLVSYF